MPVSKAMIKAGEAVATLCLVAKCCKQMNGLGGGRSYQEFLDSEKNTDNVDLAIKYANAEIESVEAIYTAMERALHKELISHI